MDFWEEPGGRLATILGKRGFGVVQDHRLLEAVLRDSYGGARREISVLVAAAKEGVVRHLAGDHYPPPRKSTIVRLSHQLHDDLGFDLPLSQWAIETWLAAILAVALAPFVDHAYSDILGRSPTRDEVGECLGQLLGGRSAADIAAQLTDTNEYREGLITAFYVRCLHRTPDTEGVSTYTDQLARGRRREEVLADILGSDEYFEARAGRSDDTFLAAVYGDLLDRGVDDRGRDDYLADLRNGQSRRDIAYSLITSSEYRERVVTDLYQRVHGREPDAGGLAHWRALLSPENPGLSMTYEQVLSTAVGSDEYVARVMRAVTVNDVSRSFL